MQLICATPLHSHGVTKGAQVPQAHEGCPIMGRIWTGIKSAVPDQPDHKNVLRDHISSSLLNHTQIPQIDFNFFLSV